jgi:hypothetical protein
MAICRSFAIVNLAFAQAWVNVARGRRFETWSSGQPVVPGHVTVVTTTEPGQRERPL